MASEPDRRVQAQIRTLFDVGVTAGLTDGQLLERYSSRRGAAGEVAFATLVERHGPRVLSTCRKILRDDHEAEDVLQATFLVLAFKGGSLWVQDSIGPWIHRVACRIALRARRSADRREMIERSAAKSAADASFFEAHDLLIRALHEEIDRLPDRYRVPVVLCDLEGHTYDQAARHLGCPVGTVKSRLARGRQRLRVRLTRRGLTFPAGLLAATLFTNASKAAVPAALSDSVVQAAMRVAAGATAAGAVPTSIATLTEGMLRIMSRTTLARCVGAVLSLSFLTVGIGVLAQRTADAPPQDKRTVEPAKPAPSVLKGDDPPQKEEARAAEIVARVANIGRDRPRDGGISTVAIDPETGTWYTIAKNLPPGSVSPDGRTIVYSQMGEDHDKAELGIWVYDLTGAVPTRRIFEQNGTPYWSHDGQDVVIGVWLEAGKFETWRVHADDTGRTRLPIAETEFVLGCTRDGNWLATRSMGGDPAHWGRLTLVHPDGTGARTLTEGSAKQDVFSIPAFSPDGRSIAYVEIKTEQKVRRSKLFVMDLDGANRREIPIAFEPGLSGIVHWSPDGSRLALNAMNSKTKEGSIALVNLDGSNYQKLPLPPGTWYLMISDWKTITPGLRVRDTNELTDEKAKTPRGRYQALLEEINKAKPFEPKRYVGRFLQLAESAPEDRAAVDAWIWIVTFGFDSPEYSRAVDRLAERHAETVKVGHAALAVVYKTSPDAAKLLRAVIAKNPDRDIKGLACLALGRHLKLQSERIRALKEDPESAKQWEAGFIEEGSSKEGFARTMQRDPAAMMKEAEVVLDRTAREFGDVHQSEDVTLGEEGRAELDEIRNLCAGKPAPEITGVDADGKPFTLSDYRGKVVVVLFWADWCGAGRNMYTKERSLVDRMQGKPFVMLGVNEDKDKDQLRELMKQKSINWRSWWDGGGNANTPGPIARRYNVHGWPTLYLLDHRGIIRDKPLGYPDSKRFDLVIDALVNAAEAEAGAP